MVSSRRRDDVNLDNVKGAALRQVVDEFYIEMSGSLRNAYHVYWRHKLPRKWFKWDVRATQAASKKQYEVLFGLLKHIHVVLLFKVNQKLSLVPWSVLGGMEKLESSRDWIQDAAQRYDLDLQEIRQFIVRWFQGRRKLNVDPK